VKLAVLGDPLAFTRSPELHRAGLAALGIPCESQALRTPPVELGARLAELAAAEFAGVNLTHPLKETALDLVAQVSDAARASRSINTIRFDPAGPRGETTDGTGFVDLLATLGRDAGAERVVLFGAGGAARSLALALRASGAGVHVATRDPARAAAAWAAIPGEPPAARSADATATALRAATLVVNAAPESGARAPVAPEATPAGALLVDLTYGAAVTPWVTAAVASGRRAIDGLGLLVHQARRSIELWTGRDPGIEPLARAVGWRP
jgi:shikimate dehydrogenase